MTRAHVRLLGPCFKTGRMGNRPIRRRPDAPEDGVSPRAAAAVGEHCEQSSPVETATDGESLFPNDLAGKGFLGPQAGRLPGAITLRPCGRSYLPTGAEGGPRTGRGALPPKSALPPDGRRRAGRAGEGPELALPPPGES